MHAHNLLPQFVWTLKPVTTQHEYSMYDQKGFHFAIFAIQTYLELRLNLRLTSLPQSCRCLTSSPSAPRVFDSTIDSRKIDSSCKL
jgi:hypothetical protein